jgi:hypothetical protein
MNDGLLEIALELYCITARWGIAWVGNIHPTDRDIADRYST